MRRLFIALLLVIVAAAGASAQTVSGDRFRFNTGPCYLRSGSGSPEASVTGSPCDTYWRTDTASLYLKTSGSATNTGWTLFASSSSLSGSGTATRIAGWSAASVLEATGLVYSGANITTGVWQGTPVVTTYGGTGLSAWTAGDVPYYASGTALSKLGIGTTRQILQTNAGATDPEWTSDLLTSTTIGTAYIYRVGGTDVSLADGGTSKSLTADLGAIAYSDADSLELLASTATAGKHLRSGASAAPTWSVPTWPNAAASASYLRGDGTDWIESTLKLPNSATANYVPYATATNTWGESANFTFDGTDLTLGSASALKFGTTISLARVADNRLGLASGDSFESNYTSGWAGSGYSLNYNQSYASESFLQVDRLSVRGIMDVYELLVHQIRATNGSIFVANTGKAKAVTDNGGGSYTIETEGDHGFAEDDLIRAQRFSMLAGGASVYQSDLTVTAVADTTHFTATLRATYTAPAAGMEFVRLGNTSTADRQGSIYLTADDTNAPYINVLSGVASFENWGTTEKTRMRAGNLNGSYGYSSNLYGVGIGDSGGTSVTVDATDGIRFLDGATKRGQLSASLWTLGDTATEHIAISTTAFQVKDSTTVYADLTAGVLALGDTANENVLVNTSGVSLRDSTTVYGQFAATTTLGVTSEEHLSLTSSGIQFKNSSTVNGSLAADIWTLGQSGAEHVTIDTSGVSLYDSATLYGRFAATTTLGVTTEEHLSLTSSGIEFKNSSTVLGSMTSSAWTLGDASAANTYITSTAIALRYGSTAYLTANSNGIQVDPHGSAYTDANAYKFTNDWTAGQSGLFSYKPSTTVRYVGLLNTTTQVTTVAWNEIKAQTKTTGLATVTSAITQYANGTTGLSYVSLTASGIELIGTPSSSGEHTFTSGLVISSYVPGVLTSKLYNSSGNLYWGSTLIAAGGAATGIYTSSGLTNTYIPKATGAATIENSSITDTGSLVTFSTQTKFPAATWIVDGNGAERIHFASGGRTYIKAPVASGTDVAHEWRNSADTAIMTLDGAGRLGVANSISAGAGVSGTTGTFSSTTTHGGATSSTHVKIENNQVSAWNGAAVSTLYFNYSGGAMNFGNGAFTLADGTTGAAAFAGNLNVASLKYIYLDGGSDTAIQESSANVITLYSAGVAAASISSTAATFAGTLDVNGATTYVNTLTINENVGGASVTLPTTRGSSGQILTTDGAGGTSWASVVTSYPGAGLAKSTGSAWDTSVADNSANWNTAYGWGNHASAGYPTGSGTSGYLPKWTGTSVLGNSILTESGSTVTAAGSVYAQANLAVDSDEGSNYRHVYFGAEATNKPTLFWYVPTSKFYFGYLGSPGGYYDAQMKALTLAYDDANYVTLTPSSGGDLTIAPSGGDVAVSGGISGTTGSFSTSGLVGNALPAGDKFAVVFDTNSSVIGRVRNDSSGAAAYAMLAVNAYGNSWGIRMGSAAANGNALEFVLDLSAPSIKATLDTAGSVRFAGSITAAGSHALVLNHGNSDTAGFLSTVDSDYGWSMYDRSTEGDFVIKRHAGAAGVEAFRIARYDGIASFAASVGAYNGSVYASAGSGTSYAAVLSSAYNYPYIDSYFDAVAGNGWEGRLHFRTSSGGGAPADHLTITHAGAAALAGTLTVSPSSIQSLTVDTASSRPWVYAGAGIGVGAAYGAGAIKGPTLGVGYNSSGSGAAGTIAYTTNSSVAIYTWVDNAGNLRLHSAAPTADGSTVSDTAGVVVGTQTSTRASKHILGEYLDNNAALALILGTPVWDYTYRSGAYNHQRFVGITTDDSPEFGMDLGRSFNPVNAFGYSVAAMKALHARIVDLEARIMALEQVRGGKQQ